MIPERKWGQPFDPSKLTMTAKFIIEKHQPAVASYLGFNSGYHSRQEEIEKAREEASASMAKNSHYDVKENHNIDIMSDKILSVVCK